MVVPLGQQYNIGEKPTVILYSSYINRHAGRDTRKTAMTKQLLLCVTSSNNKDESNTIIATRTEVHDDVESSYQVHDPVIHLEVDEEQ